MPKLREDQIIEKTNWNEDWVKQKYKERNNRQKGKQKQGYKTAKYAN